MTIPINLAVEDVLSELVLRRLLVESGRNYSIGSVHIKGGFGYLRNTIKGWNSAAKSIPILVLTDLDSEECAPTLIDNWLPVGRNPNLIFRVAVKEVEAWLLADYESLGTYLKLRSTRIIDDPEGLLDPKATLIALARASRSSELRKRLVPRRGSTAKQGPDYNACLATYVKESWDINVASQRAQSLEKTLQRLREFTPTWR
jgi:hypothetical protein